MFPSMMFTLLIFTLIYLRFIIRLCNLLFYTHIFYSTAGLSSDLLYKYLYYP